MLKLTVQSIRFLSAVLLWFAAFVVINGQQDWMNLVVNEIEIADTLTAGCDIPVNITIENVGEDHVNTSSYRINYLIDREEPTVPFSFLLPEIILPVDGIVLPPGGTITIRQELPVREPVFDFPTDDETIEKNVVIVWGGGVADDNEDHLLRETDVTSVDVVDASIADVDTLDISGPINPDDFDLLEGSTEEECFPFDDFVSSEILQGGSDYYIRCQTVFDEYVFWSLDGNFIKCDNSPEILGEVENLPFHLEQNIIMDLGFEANIGFIELIELEGSLLYNLEDVDVDMPSFLFNLNYELVGYNGGLFSPELIEITETVAYFFPEDVEIVDSQILDNGQILIFLSDESTIYFDSEGNFLFFEDVSSDSVLTGQIESEELPTEFTDLVDGSFPDMIVEYSYFNDLNCNVVFQASVDGVPVYTFDVASGIPNQILVGIEGLADIDTKIYPNPSSGSLFLSGDLEELREIRVYDSKGKLVHSQLSSFESNLSLEYLKVGIYFVHLISGKGPKILPWVKI